MNYAIGLDVGIGSVGYAVLEVDSIGNPFRIELLGSRIFDKAEHPKDGSSLALPRREARGARRRLRRHRHRLERIRGLIVSSDILTTEQLENLYYGKLTDIYELRTRALDEKVTPQDFARILIHLAQRRGYQSNRKAESAIDSESGKLLSAIVENRELCKTKGYRTIGEMFYKDERFSQYKRNKQESYQNTVERAAIEAEARMIFAAQRKYGVSYANEKLEDYYLDILLGQRSFAEGPACGPYSGNQVEKMRGRCTFEKSEPRAAKASYSFQLFNLWQHINHIRIKCRDTIISLNDEERQKIYNLALEKTVINFAQIRKCLDMSEDADFVGIHYENGKRDEAEKKAKIKDLEIYHKIRKCVETVSVEAFALLGYEQLDAIGEALSKNQSDDDISKELASAGIIEPVISALLTLPNFPKYGHLSVVAYKKIIPFLQAGMTYDKACGAAGYNFKAQKNDAQMYLPPLSNDSNEITNPVVRRSVSQTIKVVNAIIREMGVSPVYINIELARELSHDLNERNKIKRAQDDNAEKNERLMQQLREYGNDCPGGQDLIKLKLWQEQDGRCIYSGEVIEIERLTEPGYVDVDHIVPYSVCFDDRIINKVLVLAKENRQKGNRLPLQYLQGKRRDEFIMRVNQSNLKYAKKNRLLKESIDNVAEWKQRNLQDTQYISSFLHRYIEDNLCFCETVGDRKRRVTAVNGAITSYVRKRWGIRKIREDGDLHHAIDAVVIACITQAMINKISRYSYYKETKDNGDFVVDESTGEVVTKFPVPWTHFLDELEIRLTQNEKNLRKQLFDVNYDSYAEIDIDTVKPPFVSRMSNHKVTGAAHKETVRSGKLEEQGMVISKVPLSSLKLDKNGEIENYYCPESDLLLYEAIKKRLLAYGGDGKRAFAEGEFYKPKSDGTRGPLVKKVKVADVASAVVRVQDKNGVAENDTMVRCDVFYVAGDGYYFVPIYVADTVKDKLPSLAPVAGRDKNNQKIRKRMSEENFVFSLYKNDLIRVYSKKDISLNVVNKKGDLPAKMTVSGDEGVFLYYKGMDIAVATLNGITHDNTYEHRSIGKTMKRIEKYEVDVLGNVRKIDKEKRRDFSQKKK